MTAKTDYFENLLLNAYIRNDAASQAILAAANLEGVLFYDTLNDTTSDVSLLNEANADARVSYATLSSAFGSAPTTGTMTNTGAISWTFTPAAGGTINSFAIVDSTVTPDRVWYYVVVSAITPGANSVVQYAGGALTIVEA